jgi:hypothetical protein
MSITVVNFPRRNIQNETTEYLVRAWNEWDEFPEDDGKHQYHYEQIHAELNRRGEGLVCAV